MEQISVTLQMCFADVVLQDLLLLRVLLEVFFERSVAHKLFLEL